jgi:hypothetical protein
MASNTKETRFKRKLRKKNAGRQAKSLRARTGTTPAFPVHTPEADANAPNQAKPSSNG